MKLKGLMIASGLLLCGLAVVEQGRD